MTETWKPIPNFPGYEVSDQGRVLSRLRHHGSNGPRILKPATTPDGYQVVNLRGSVQRIHFLVQLAFVGPRPEGAVIRHLDGDCTNNTASNLRYGTTAENTRDSIRHGSHAYAARTHCKNGHEFSPENTKCVERRGGTTRRCKACKRDWMRRSRLQSIGVAA